ncbi:hypothetical protein KUCAC02_007582 [Chaenocephalus aceratus]|uniref:Uncharacterized protein n=1 Tax=Chaenocephalus aceratus TaxID=36190 RepID=A0ACB9X7R4_CHAAC|nr:hypothetical protein KUCAC02_007582 [Chaenocephalus aceratus]
MKCHIALSLVEKNTKITSYLAFMFALNAGHKLFSSMSKFEHSTPWPAFSQTIHEDSVTKHPEAWGPLKKRLMDRRVSCEREERVLLLKVRTVDEGPWNKA